MYSRGVAQFPYRTLNEVFETQRLYFGRATCRNCHYRDLGRTSVARKTIEENDNNTLSLDLKP